MSKIQPEDLILINRDGVDYQAKVEDLPDSGGDTGSGVDPNEYARLDGATFTEELEIEQGNDKAYGITRASAQEISITTGESKEALADKNYWNKLVLSSGDGVFIYKGDGTTTGFDGDGFVGDGGKLTGLPTPTLSDVVTTQGNPDSNKVNGSICLDGSNSRWFKVSGNSDSIKMTHQSIEIDGNFGMTKTGRTLIRTSDTQFFPSSGSSATVSIDNDKGTVSVNGSNSGFIGDGSQLTNVPLPDFRTLTALS